MPDTNPTAAVVFDALWSELVLLLGTAAASTLVRRAARRACARSAELCEVRVERDGWRYTYTLPAGWATRPPAEVPAFAELVSVELVPLLQEFTGQIVLRRLQRVPALAALQLSPMETL